MPLNKLRGTTAQTCFQKCSEEKEGEIIDTC